MKKTISLVLVLALGLAVESTNADFTFFTPTNLGPIVNSSANDWAPCISDDGLSLYFTSARPGGYGGNAGGFDIWVTTRETTEDDWSTPVNVGLPVNSAVDETQPCISADGLSLFFDSYRRPGGVGGTDLWVATRAKVDDPWSEPVNLGPTVNSSSNDNAPSISADGLSLFFHSARAGSVDLWGTTRPSQDSDWEQPQSLGPAINSPQYGEACPSISADGLRLYFFSDRIGGQGGRDLWMIKRATKDDLWGPPLNLGPIVNTASAETSSSTSADAHLLYFCDLAGPRPGGLGGADLWQAPIFPIVDLNVDGTVDIDDLVILIEHWGTDEPLCDIGPTPFGDGIVDVQDLIVLAEHLFGGISPVEPEEVNVDEGDADSQVKLEQGRILVVTLESNPTTGYGWEVAENQESILEQMGEAEFKQSETSEPPLVGAGGWEIFRFKAISAGQMTLQLVYHRPWEEGVEPLKTFSLQVVVR